MDEIGKAESGMTRKEFLKKGAKIVGGITLAGGGLAVLNKLAHETENKPDPLTSSLKSEVLPVENEDDFKRRLREKYNIEAGTNISTFAIVTTNERDNKTKLSFAVVPQTEGQISCKAFIQGVTDEEPVELLRLVAPQVYDIDISWYIPEGVRTERYPKMQGILSFRVGKKDAAVKVISFHPPDRETISLTGAGVSREEMARVHFPLTPDMLPDKALQLLSNTK